jgi:hypothetical protein
LFLDAGFLKDEVALILSSIEHPESSIGYLLVRILLDKDKIERLK